MESRALTELENEEERRALLAATGGDQGPLGNILGGYTQRLRHMLRLRISPQLAGRVGVSDVLQEAFMEVTERLPKYLESRQDPAGRGAMPFFLWVRFLVGQQLHRAYRFHLGTPKRDVGREQALEIGGFPGASSACLALALSDSGISPSGAASAQEAQELLAEALDELSAEEREILVLRHFEYLSNREIAHLLGLSEPGSSLRHLRALKRLKSVLGQKGLDFPG